MFELKHDARYSIVYTAIILMMRCIFDIFDLKHLAIKINPSRILFKLKIIEKKCYFVLKELFTFGKYVFLISYNKDFGLNWSECKININ